MVSSRPLISKFSSPCTNPLVIVSRASITIGITVTFMFHNCFFHFLEEFVSLILRDRFWVVQISFVQMVKFKFLAQLPLVLVFYSVVYSLRLFLSWFVSFAHYVIDRFVSTIIYWNYCYYLLVSLFYSFYEFFYTSFTWWFFYPLFEWQQVSSSLRESSRYSCRYQ